jgi:UDP-N-acetylmuramyl pentapeptide phosphotransferase/UDP-N-acetylglucosamine-1-phosphate transferase
MKYLILLTIFFIIHLLYSKIADKFDIIDKPNLRSSHKDRTVQGGGIIFFIGVLVYFLMNGFQYPWFFAGLTLITAISFADDLRSNSVILRLFVHFAATALMFYQWEIFSYSWYFIAAGLVFCAGILNAYNFMDGINGMTGGYSLVLLLTLLYINNCQVLFIDNELLYIVCLTLLVFSFFNFRTKAKCFAGDTGAMSVAFILVFLLGSLIIKTEDFSYIILLSVYGVDSVLTIIHRLILKENILVAHRLHIYQIMANELDIPHIFVSLIYMLLQTMIIVGFFIAFEYRYLYIVIIMLLLSTGYILFIKKYFTLFHLSE